MLFEGVRAASTVRDLNADLTIDIESTVCETFGLAKQGADRVRPHRRTRYNHPVASLAKTGEFVGQPQPGSSPMVVARSPAWRVGRHRPRRRQHHRRDHLRVTTLAWTGHLTLRAERGSTPAR
jgi:hypothetical protein